ncbi:MAG TPA: hypothetical protein VFL92_00050 [Sphingomonas sp.]|nr:hypothetical protein [Sphingomonas sp.]
MTGHGAGDGARAAGDAFARAHARLLADRSIQFDLPKRAEPHIPEWLKALGRLIEAAWPVIRVLVWFAVAALLIALVWIIASRFLDVRLPWAKRGETSEAEPEWRPEAAPARALLAEADALAAQGRYGEAAHLVLERSIEDIVRRRPKLVRPATTSRDLAHAPELPAAARPAFAAIAQVVERSLFGARAADREAWSRARAAYADFALPGNWR